MLLDKERIIKMETVLIIILSIIILIILIKNKKLRKELECGDLQMFKEASENTDVGITILDHKDNNKIIYTNIAFEKITGYKKSKILGKTLRFLVANDTDQQSIFNIKEAIQNKYKAQDIVRCYRKDGTLFYNQLTVSPTFDSKGNTSSFIVTHYDITKQRQREKQLEQHAKLASIGEMIGNIAHQWRQPLSIISTSATGIMAKKEFDQLTDEFLENSCNQINENAQYLSQTLDSFKNFIEGDTKPIRFDLKNDTNSFVNIVDSSIKAYHLRIILDLEEDVKVKGYPNELIQCFINIFNNAKDALVENNDTDNRYIFITQRIRNNKIIINFKDNAGGIKEDVIGRVFEPYFTTKHQSQGTGLGLHMTYNLIVNHMRGSIEVKNQEYGFNDHVFKGASFTITLPLS